MYKCINYKIKFMSQLVQYQEKALLDILFLQIHLIDLNLQ